MRVFVLGAGASKPAGYPLGPDLLREVDAFVRSCGPCTDRFNYQKEWPSDLDWLENNPNPVIRHAFKTGQLEHLFTELDLASLAQQDALGSIWRERAEPKEAEARWRELHTATERYREVRQHLLWGLEAWLGYQHTDDANHAAEPHWDYLRDLGRKLCDGDVVITFNYDSTVERILWEQRKWSPEDGYGWLIVFQKSRSDKTAVSLGPSRVKILHLHGAIGWYKKPVFVSDFESVGVGGPVSRAELGPTPLETEIALDPLFLTNLNIPAVDASLPDRPSADSQILLHPSFLKDYEQVGSPNRLFEFLWQEAAKCLREADEVVVAGYSLPHADSAAWVLLVTNCVPAKVKIVNPSYADFRRLEQLLAHGISFLGGAKAARALGDWLKDQPDCKMLAG